MQWIDALLQGLMLGGLYALFAAGLSLMFGVMRLVNVAHGDFIVLSAFVVVGLLQALHIESLLLASLLVVPLMAGFGYGLQRLVLNPTLGGDMLRPVLVTFGLSVIVQNALLQGASADARRLQAGGLEHVSLPLFGPLAVGAFPLLTFGLAVLAIVLLQALLYRTALGRALRAVADDGEVAGLMGVHDRHLFGAATAIAFGVVALAGVLMGVRSSFDPSMGPERLIFAFEAVIVGGMGSMWGTLAGGVLIGMAQSLGSTVSPEWQILAGHLVFLAVLIVRPQGFFPKVMA
jgi:branched-chain amino acid transport system permease protein